MHEFRVHTLVDITDNGSLAKQFPFKTPCGDVVHDRQTLATAKNQNSNFSTMLQLLQIRGNLVWEEDPLRLEHDLNLTGFGSYYEGQHNSWHFTFFTEQADIFATQSFPMGELQSDFNHVPIITGCRETANFPIKAFVTKNLQQPTSKEKVINALSGDIINTYFTYGGYQNK